MAKRIWIIGDVLIKSAQKSCHLRAAGYDGIVGYSKIKGANRLSEAFDIQKKTYPMGIKGLLGLVPFVAGGISNEKTDNKTPTVRGVPPGIVLEPIPATAANSHQ